MRTLKEGAALCTRGASRGSNPPLSREARGNALADGYKADDRAGGVRGGGVARAVEGEAGVAEGDAPCAP